MPDCSSQAHTGTAPLMGRNELNSVLWDQHGLLQSRNLLGSQWENPKPTDVPGLKNTDTRARGQHGHLEPPALLQDLHSPYKALC